MSELPAGVPRAVPPQPRRSAAGLVVRRAGHAAGGFEVLMVLRARKTRFMPGHLAFPGGTLDPEDRPGESGDLVRCTAREVQEETGLAIDVEDWIDAGQRITPPMFPVRFDNRFFLSLAPAKWVPPADSPSPDEVESIAFHDAGQVLADWAGGRAKLPPPVLPLLRLLADWRGDDALELAAACAAANELEERVPRIEFVPDIWMVPLSTATLPPATHTNVWMPGGRKFVVIDPGSTEDAEHARLLDVIERARSCGREPVAVLLTHGHQDHVGGVVRLARELAIPLRAHASVLAGLDLADVRAEPIEDNERIDLDGMTLQALLTPGHAPGHLAFHVPERNVVIAGDLVSGISTILIEPETGDMGAYLDSLERVHELGVALLLAGHGPPLPARALDRLIQHRRKREQLVLDGVSDKPETLSAIARVVYADVPNLPAGLVELQALSHLQWLERQGRVERVDETRWRRVDAEPSTASEIERILRERFAPIHLQIRDDSANHAGHAGASSGGGHYKVVLVTAAFDGESLLARHRMVNDAVRDLFGARIHALALKTLAPAEWDG